VRPSAPAAPRRGLCFLRCRRALPPRGAGAAATAGHPNCGRGTRCVRSGPGRRRRACDCPPGLCPGETSRPGRGQPGPVGHAPTRQGRVGARDIACRHVRCAMPGAQGRGHVPSPTHQMHSLRTMGSLDPERQGRAPALCTVDDRERAEHTSSHMQIGDKAPRGLLPSCTPKTTVATPAMDRRKGRLDVQR
jgi:hypothetical protein